LAEIVEVHHLPKPSWTTFQMNYRRARQIFFTIACICFSEIGFSQSIIRLGASADKHNILLGEQLVLTLKAELPANAPPSFFEIDSIPHFEILSSGPIDTITTENGISISQQLYITSFDSGSRVIPSFNLPRNRRMVTPAITIEVGYSQPFDPDAAYHDIKDIIGGETQEDLNTTWWYLAGAALILVLILVYIFDKRKKPATPVLVKVNAYEIAMEQLKELQQKDLDPKIYFTRLSYIFREYLEKRKGIYSMQKTTDDLVIQLKDLNIPAEDFAKLSQTLRLSDYVKFAKYPASRQEMDESLHIIKTRIQAIDKTTTNEL
jgi:hypothetical protein